MSQFTKAAWAAAILAVALIAVVPAVVRLAHVLLVPVVVIALLCYIGRVIWYYTSR